MKNGKYIVLQYPLGELDLQTVHEIFHCTQDALPEYNVIAIPECVKWFEMTREELMQVRGILDWILEKKNDSDSEAGTRT